MGRLKCEQSNAQTDKFTETDRRTDRHMYGLTHRQADAGLAYKGTDRNTDRQTDPQTDRHTDGQTHRCTDTRTDRLIHGLTHACPWSD